MIRLKKISICFGVFGLFFIFISKNQVNRAVPCKALDAQEPGLISEMLNDVEMGFDCSDDTIENQKDHKVYASERQKRDFFKSIGCQYINFMDIKCAPSELPDPKDSAHYKSDSKNILELSEKYRNDIQNKKLASMYISLISKKVGHGIFATMFIKSGDFIGTYAGEVCSGQALEDTEFAWDYGAMVPSGDRLILDGKYRGNELRFINHAKDPNTRAVYLIADGKLHVCYIAQKDIAAGQQLTVSYGDDYWTTRNVQPESFQD
ncbi:MAG: SET domain-containing protein-lysine N-methyltransferase [Candidatus Dependentiae bacterium]|nr:SET domain-containing protein-lysine N-methyltransferase [Candidatus Dependentiae bacterium]